MLRFLRQIRKRLMQQNNVRTYIFYAIGEILLVVVGILIALQVNNWNEKRIAQEQEKSTLISLNQEAENNITIIDKCINDIKKEILGAEIIRSEISPEFPDISADSLNHLLGITGVTQRCFVSTDIVDELQSSGNLKMIREVAIRRQVGVWLSALDDLQQEQQEWLREFSREYIPYTNRWIAWDDVDYILNKDDPAYFISRFDIDPRPILQDFEFSNIFAIHYWRMTRYRDRVLTLKEETGNLSDMVESKISERD